MRYAARRIGIVSLMTTLALVMGGACPAHADLVVEYSSNVEGTFPVDIWFGWSFTTNQAILVTALDAQNPTGGTNNVQLYDGMGDVLAEATVTTADPQEGSPTSFYSASITPVLLQADTTYYIAQFVTAPNGIGYQASGLTVSPLITFGTPVSSQGSEPTGNSGGFGGYSYFGPDFDAQLAITTPEPSTLIHIASASLAGVWWAWRRNRLTRAV
jgi:hypothetical protein